MSPDLKSMEQIRRIMRPTDVPDQGLLCDLLWSDPDKDTNGWGENDRGVSFTFGVEVSRYTYYNFSKACSPRGPLPQIGINGEDKVCEIK